MLAMRQQEERLSSLMRYSSEISAILDTGGRFSYVNPAIEPILGLTVEETLGRDLWSLVHPDDAAVIREAFIDLVATPRANRTPRAADPPRRRIVALAVAGHLQPAGRAQRARRGLQRPGHHRDRGLPGAAALRGDARPAHPAGEPCPARKAPAGRAPGRPGDGRPHRPGRARPHPGRPGGDAGHRPRRLQEGQRQPRPPRRRSVAAGRRRPAARLLPGDRHGRPAGRRRVRRPAARRHRRGGRHAPRPASWTRSRSRCRRTDSSCASAPASA